MLVIFAILIFIIVYHLITGIIKDGMILSNDIIENMAKSRKHHKVLKNIYGKPLKKCRRKKTSKNNENNGSWDKDGYCSEMGGGVHQICFDVDDNTKNFSSATYQDNWSENRIGNNHCMCLGAWALYKARQKKGEIATSRLVCDAIPETALTPQYINKWNMEW